MPQCSTPPSFPTVVVTGASSGVALHAARSLAARGWFGVMACRDPAKAARVAREHGIPADHHAVLTTDLGAQRSVRAFVDAFHVLGRPAGDAGHGDRELDKLNPGCAADTALFRAQVRTGAGATGNRKVLRRSGNRCRQRPRTRRARAGSGR